MPLKKGSAWLLPHTQTRLSLQIRKQPRGFHTATEPTPWQCNRPSVHTHICLHTHTHHTDTEEGGRKQVTVFGGRVEGKGFREDWGHTTQKAGGSSV